jgi:DNA-binding MarR family transcriptional regulator
MSEPGLMKGWTFLTNHAHVLVCITHDPGIRVREIADRVGITERATQRIVADLAGAGYIERSRVGRRTAYTINGRLPLRHPLEEHREIGALLDALSTRANPRRGSVEKGSRP